MIRFRAALLAVLFPLAACDVAEPLPAAGEAPASEADFDPALLALMPAGTSAETLARGRELYAVCSVCHGLDGEGTQLGPSFRDTTWIHLGGSVPEIVEITRAGIDRPAEFPIPMPPMGGGDFDEAELRAVATYVYALGRQAD